MKIKNLVGNSPRILRRPKTITFVDLRVFKLSSALTAFVSAFRRDLLLSLFQVSESDSRRNCSSIYRQSFQKGFLTQIFLILNSFPTKKSSPPKFHYHSNRGNMSNMGSFLKVFFLLSWDGASLMYSSITNKMQRYTMVFITINALHLSGGSSAHHQELKTVPSHSR
jgi:hypothetical protein